MKKQSEDIKIHTTFDKLIIFLIPILKKKSEEDYFLYLPSHAPLPKIKMNY